MAPEDGPENLGVSVVPFFPGVFTGEEPRGGPTVWTSAGQVTFCGFTIKFEHLSAPSFLPSAPWVSTEGVEE